ncbi:MAG: STAS domain-containing protein [Chitinophagaceae bacterium]|jgi:anti-anti-sigma factor|nr:STAS domain-containing protein [Chitinophagaceae bacterium]
MQVKIDTKEKFHVITVTDPSLTADMSDNINDTLIPYLQNDVPNIILNLEEVQHIDNQTAELLVKIQQKFYEAGCSLVVCALGDKLENFLDNLNLLEMMNVTPTTSEAGDIVLMEEIERELMQGDDL